jgi:quercetin dioxygenase-like cupin family protein
MYSVQDARTEFVLPPFSENPGAAAALARTGNVSGREVTYVYAIDELDAVPEGSLSAKVTPRNYISKKSTSFGAALSGERVHVAVIGKVRATGTKLHTHPNEQFSFVLQGQARYEIDGQTAEAPRGSVTHIPPGTVHGVVAYPEEDVVTFVAKDTSHGMSGPPIDGKEDGPVYWPGFDPRQR